MGIKNLTIFLKKKEFEKTFGLFKILIFLCTQEMKKNLLNNNWLWQTTITCGFSWR